MSIAERIWVTAFCFLSVAFFGPIMYGYSAIFGLVYIAVLAITFPFIRD